MAKLLYKTNDRSKSHLKLEQILSEETYPRACCREDPNSEAPFEVWTDDDPEVESPLSPLLPDPS